MTRARIHSAGPRISELEVEYVLDAIRNGWYDNYRGYIEAFEAAFARYLGVKYALATSHGTGALHLALAASGVGPGDEVVVPDISWIATANVVRHCGAVPVFVDVRLSDWNIDPDAIAAAITPRTKAVFPVHLYGHPADMIAIERIAERAGILVVEDAAPSVGSLVHGRRPGTFGAAAGFSFQGAKVLATGQGGMFTTDSEAAYRRAVSLYEHGRKPEHGIFYSAEVGFNYKMPNLAAAMGLAQLERIDELVARKRYVYGLYRERLGAMPGITFQEEGSGAVANWSYPSVRIDPEMIDRDALVVGLKARGIDTRPAFPRMSAMPAFAVADTPRAKEIERTGLNLPTAGYLEPADVDQICNAIGEVIAGAR